jgi:hypothetical protein
LLTNSSGADAAVTELVDLLWRANELMAAQAQ